MGTYYGYAKTGTGILGLFNCVQRPLAELIRLSDFPGTEQGEYIVRAFDGVVSKPMSRGEKHAFVGAKVDVQGWDILSAHPVRHFKRKASDEISVAFLGLVGKMTGIAAIQGSDVYEEENGRLRIWLSFKALGVFGLWINDLPRRSIDGGMMLLVFGKVVPRHCIRRSKACDKVLEVDMLQAWEELGEDSGWSNEVNLEIFIA